MDLCMDMGLGFHLKIIKISKNRVIKPNHEILWRELEENFGMRLKEKE